MPAATASDGDYSPTWKWADDELLEGTHVEFRRATTDSGEKVVWEIETYPHGPVSVWVEPAALVAKVRGELARRKAKTGEPRLQRGEQIRINPGAKRPSRRNPSQTVWPFPVVWFEHGIPDTAAEEFLLDDTAEPPAEDGDALDEAAEAEIPPLPPAADDDIPF